jgi:hypothetical protein
LVIRAPGREKNTKAQLLTNTDELASLRTLNAVRTTFSAKEIVRDAAVCYKGHDSQDFAMPLNAVSFLPIARPGA